MVPRGGEKFVSRSVSRSRGRQGVDRGISVKYPSENCREGNMNVFIRWSVQQSEDM